MGQSSTEINVGALIIGLGFWGIYHTLIIIRNPQNSIGNYLGPHIKIRGLLTSAASYCSLSGLIRCKGRTGSGLREAKVLGFRVRGLGFRVRGLGFRGLGV